MPSEKTNTVTRQEWRDLGFFYDRDDDAKEWRIAGSKSGLGKLAAAISKFALDPRNHKKSEHDHLGPYMYLEIGCWPEPQITGHWIAGPLSLLEDLAISIREKVAAAHEGSVILLRDSFAPGSPYELRIEVKAEAFDPARADPNCW